MTDEQVLSMPIRRFWLFNESVDRLQASQDMRNLNVILGAKTPEGAKEVSDKLSEAIGTVVIKDHLRDKKALKNLSRKLLLGV